MITKEEVETLKIKAINSEEKQINTKFQTFIEKTKGIFPEVINSDGQLDAKALMDIIDIKNTTSNNQGYELTFAGKGIARHKANSPTEKELKYEPNQSKDSGENTGTNKHGHQRGQLGSLKNPEE